LAELPENYEKFLQIIILIRKAKILTSKAIILMKKTNILISEDTIICKKKYFK
jgi:hypothetical protein